MSKKTAYMVVDGSYDYEIRAAGIAGKTCIDGVSKIFDFKKSLVELKDSTEAEFKAVIHGLKQVSLQIDKGSTVEHILIGTDSLNLIGIMDPELVKEKFPKAVRKIPPVSQYKSMANEIKRIVLELGISVEYQKIKAHVENNKASVLEQIHNQVDKMAHSSMQKARRAIRGNDETKILSYSVIVPTSNKLSETEQKSLRRLGYTMAKRGFLARISGENVKDNPVLQGINIFSEGDGASFVPKDDLVTFYKPLESKQPQLVGLDRARVRLWNIKELAKDGMEMYFEESDLKKSPSKIQGGIVRLLNGASTMPENGKEFGITKDADNVVMHVDHNYGVAPELQEILNSYFQHHGTKREPLGNVVTLSLEVARDKELG
jgi:ribonuclease HI